MSTDWEGEGSTGNSGYHRHFWAERASPWPRLRQCLPVCPWCPLHSQMGTGAQSKQVRHCENLLTDVAPLRGVCRCRGLCPTQPQDRAAPRPRPVLPSVLAGRFLGLLPSVWLVHRDPRRLFLAPAPCFHHNFDLVARGMNRASVIYAIFFFLLPSDHCLFLMLCAMRHG